MENNRTRQCVICRELFASEELWTKHTRSSTHQQSYLKKLNQLGPAKFIHSYHEVPFTTGGNAAACASARDAWMQFVIRSGIANHFQCRICNTKNLQNRTNWMQHVLGAPHHKASIAMLKKLKSETAYNQKYGDVPVPVHQRYLQNWKPFYPGTPLMPKSKDEKGKPTSVKPSPSPSPSPVIVITGSGRNEKPQKKAVNKHPAQKERVNLAAMHSAPDSAHEADYQYSGPPGVGYQHGQLPAWDQSGYEHTGLPSGYGGYPWPTPAAASSNAYDPAAMVGPGLPGGMQAPSEMGHAMASNQFIIDQMQRQMSDMIQAMGDMTEMRQKLEESEGKRDRHRKRHRSRSRSRHRTRHDSRSPGRRSSPDYGHRSRSPGLRHRSRSPYLRHRSRSPGLNHRSRSPGLSHRGRSPGLSHRSRSPDLRHRISGLRHRSRSPRARHRSRSPGARYRSRSPGARNRSRSPGARHRIRSPGVRYRSRSPGARRRSRSPGARYRSRSPGARHRIRSPGPRNRHSRERPISPLHRSTSPASRHRMRRLSRSRSPSVRWSPGQADPLPRYGSYHAYRRWERSRSRSWSPAGYGYPFPERGYLPSPGSSLTDLTETDLSCTTDSLEESKSPISRRRSPSPPKIAVKVREESGDAHKRKPSVGRSVASKLSGEKSRAKPRNRTPPGGKDSDRSRSPSKSDQRDHGRSAKMADVLASVRARREMLESQQRHSPIEESAYEPISPDRGSLEGDFIPLEVGSSERIGKNVEVMNIHGEDTVSRGTGGGLGMASQTQQKDAKMFSTSHYATGADADPPSKASDNVSFQNLDRRRMPIQHAAESGETSSRPISMHHQQYRPGPSTISDTSPDTGTTDAELRARMVQLHQDTGIKNFSAVNKLLHALETSDLGVVQTIASMTPEAARSMVREVEMREAPATTTSTEPQWLALLRSSGVIR